MDSDIAPIPAAGISGGPPAVGRDARSRDRGGRRPFERDLNDQGRTPHEGDGEDRRRNRSATERPTADSPDAKRTPIQGGHTASRKDPKDDELARHIDVLA